MLLVAILGPYAFMVDKREDIVVLQAIYTSDVVIAILHACTADEGRRIYVSCNAGRWSVEEWNTVLRILRLEELCTDWTLSMNLLLPLKIAEI